MGRQSGIPKPEEITSHDQSYTGSYAGQFRCNRAGALLSSIMRCSQGKSTRINERNNDNFENVSEQQQQQLTRYAEVPSAGLADKENNNFIATSECVQVQRSRVVLLRALFDLDPILSDRRLVKFERLAASCTDNRMMNDAGTCEPYNIYVRHDAFKTERRSQ
ncbi:hypothetical protein CLF_111486 [Clonorchis sinensis]|uniref:Uncharacterized protein n=1 Tax=Clonorchis sinensis TaxID=79923 RepID=G7YLP6_CLOSI|nr:hypothetical protein CLF_111486 [Clonorchis sinensis]